VLRVPLGNREVLAFAVSPLRESDGETRRLKAAIERLDVPAAFDETGLHLARFIADRYLCTLGEALDAVILAAAVPRMRQWLARTSTPPAAGRSSAVPPRLLRLIWDEFPECFPLEKLFRDPEARRAGDRAAILRWVQVLVRSGDLRRERSLDEPRTREYRVRVLLRSEGELKLKGRKAAALLALAGERKAGVPRADAVLAGFSNAVIARALRSGALRETTVAPDRRRRSGASPPPLPPTAEQGRALARIRTMLDSRAFAEALLYGVTGSGKTYVYLESIKRIVGDGGRAMVLVPEISLTPQTAQHFESAFGERVAVLHSALSERERFEAWQACAQGEVDVVVGARSAVFAPLRGVRLLVVDESHEPSYKQDAVPRYQTLAVARERMRRENGVLLLGSATPSLESYYAATSGRLAFIEMRARATALPLPSVRVVDLTTEFESGNRRIFSTALVQAIAKRLERGHKSVLFVNRRGSAGFVLCRNCGYVPGCPRCSVALAVHRSEGLLRCHYCDHQAPVPARCGGCGLETIREFGVGTERVAEEVARLFPQARIVRMDSDTTTHVGDHARLLRAFAQEADVLVGTQMVVKGLDYPTVTLAAVVAADVGLHLPDFRAAERSFALIAQLCGRSGRARPGEAIVQTYSPQHPSVVFAAAHDYEGFARHELRERAELGFPPFCRLIYLGVIGRSRNRSFETACRYAQTLRETVTAEVLGPAPYPIARVNNEWRFRIALKTRKPAELRALIRDRIVPQARACTQTRLAINVDP
jgi:primosomal protein N' (replication factor Y) (superfamily II helicase)